MAETTDFTLTVEKLSAIVDKFPRPEITRIIVGAPGIPRDKALKWISKRILWLHQDTLDALPKATTEPSAPLFGLPVEFFSWERHGELFREFMHDLIPPTVQLHA